MFSIGSTARVEPSQATRRSGWLQSFGSPCLLILLVFKGVTIPWTMEATKTTANCTRTKEPVASAITLKSESANCQGNKFTEEKYIEEEFSVCFVSVAYWESTSDPLDRLQDVEAHAATLNANTEHGHKFGFFLYTNLAEVHAPGWTKIVTQLPYNRRITHSRWGKFMHWKERPDSCRVIFYTDAQYRPSNSLDGAEWLAIAEVVRASPNGLMQKVLKESHSPLHELDRIESSKKDISKNLDEARAWFLSQPDYDEATTMYYNTWFGYDARNLHYRRVAEFFWIRYSLERDSWRDQPLWCYTLHKLGVEPIPFPGRYPPKKLFPKTAKLRSHMYGLTDQTNAAAQPAEDASAAKITETGSSIQAA